MLPENAQLEDKKDVNDIDLENPQDVHIKSTYTQAYHGSFEKLLEQIESCQRPLMKHIYKISNKRQTNAQIIGGTISAVTGVGLVFSSEYLTNLEAIMGMVLCGLAIITLLPAVPKGGCLGYVYPYHTFNCIKYLPLNTLDNIDIEQIKETTKIVNKIFPLIPIAEDTTDVAEVVRNLDKAIKEIHRDAQKEYKKHGAEVLKALDNYGIFSNNTGPAKAILEYMIPHASIVESLVPSSAPKKK
jgi:hypothetical protein